MFLTIKYDIIVHILGDIMEIREIEERLEKIQEIKLSERTK